jgi:hypothetical protein
MLKLNRRELRILLELEVIFAALWHIDIFRNSDGFEIQKRHFIPSSSPYTNF